MECRFWIRWFWQSRRLSRWLLKQHEVESASGNPKLGHNIIRDATPFPIHRPSGTGQVVQSPRKTQIDKEFIKWMREAKIGMPVPPPSGLS